MFVAIYLFIELHIFVLLNKLDEDKRIVLFQKKSDVICS